MLVVLGPLWLFVIRDLLFGQLDHHVDLLLVEFLAQVAEVRVAEHVVAKVLVHHHCLEVVIAEDGCVEVIRVLGGFGPQAGHNLVHKLVEGDDLGLFFMDAAQLLQVSVLGGSQRNRLGHQSLRQEVVTRDFLKRKGEFVLSCNESSTIKLWLIEN